MRDVAIIGVGTTVFGKFPRRTVTDMGQEAVQAAIVDAGIDRQEIQTAYASSVFGGAVLGQRILSEVGISGIEVLNVENACAGGATAFRGAWHAVASGLYDFGLALGVESMTTSPIAGKLIPPEAGDLLGLLGHNMPAHFAFGMRRHMEKYGTTAQQFARVSVKNHHNGSLNPYSQYKDELTEEAILSSRMICDPITLLQCCPNSDGAAAVILCPLDMAQKYSAKPVTVAASVLKMGDYEHRWADWALSDLTAKCATQAYEIAGLGPEDIDVCELHDAFTYSEIAHYEELGFCAQGEGGRLIDEGATAIGGKTAVNPSGGLLSKGHPVSATGVAQVAEIVWHLRDEAGKRQHPGARVGLAHTMGGEVAGLECGACAVHILKR
ncbi:MAG: thiolase family protein [Deltaproteobacteria bacterium]|nr:thiolase family protein [Deltaproteobacteria bacterium]